MRLARTRRCRTCLVGLPPGSEPHILRVFGWVEVLGERRVGEEGFCCGKAKMSNTQDTRDDGESSSLLWPGRTRGEAEQRSRIVKAAFYAVQVFYSFFIM